MLTKEELPDFEYEYGVVGQTRSDSWLRSSAGTPLLLSEGRYPSNIEPKKKRLDPEVVGTPSPDRSFDLLLVESLESLLRKGGKLGIRSKP